MIDIIIPIWNQAETTVRCLLSISLYTTDYRLILINNGSRPEEIAIVKDAIARLKIDARWIEFETNEGFPVAVNRGLKESTSDPVIVMNNDVTVTKNWLEKMRSYIARHRFSGVTGVLQDVCEINHYKKFYGNVLFPEEINAKPESDRKIIHSCVPFSLVALRRAMIDQIGYLDEEFSPCLGEDDDYCDRARIAGWDTVILLNVLIHHDHRTSVKMIPNYEAIQKRNLELYHSKYRARRRK